jgi:hypothetical protein
MSRLRSRPPGTDRHELGTVWAQTCEPIAGNVSAEGGGTTTPPWVGV